MNKMLDKAMSKYADWGLVFLRFGIGIIFLVHGIGKLFGVGPVAAGIGGTSGYFAGLGIPAAVFFAWLVALVETFGGLFILLGLFTRYAALAISVEMLVAFFLVHWPKGFSIFNGGYEWPLILLMGSVTLVFSGAGKKLVLEHLIK